MGLGLGATRARRLALGAALCAAVLAGLAARGAPAGLVSALAYLLPVLLLLGLLLVLRRYPGERKLLALMRGRWIRPRRARRDVAPRRSVGLRVSVPRGGRLIAFSLAVRPPPAPAVASFS